MTDGIDASKFDDEVYAFERDYLLVLKRGAGDFTRTGGNEKGERALLHGYPLPL